MLARRRVRSLASVALSASLLTAGVTSVVNADPSIEPSSPDLTAAFSDFASSLPGSVQLAVSAAGSDDDPLVLKSDGRLAAPSVRTTSVPPKLTPTGKTRCKTVMHIGDSTSVAIDQADYISDAGDRATAQYKRVGVDKVVLDATGGRSIHERVNNEPNAAEGVDTLLGKGLRGCWVISMGVNDTGNIAAGSAIDANTRIDTIMNKLKDQDVLWPTITTVGRKDYYSKANMDKFNNAVKAATSRFPRLRVFDIAAKTDPAWFANGDGIHYAPAGAIARNRQFADALAAEFPEMSALAPTSATTTPVAAPATGSDSPAWGSIRIPIALAAARAQPNDLTKVTAAIADSDPAAVADLWRELGDKPGDAVTEAIGSLGDAETKVSGTAQTSYEDLARTAWSTASQAKFGAGLLCAKDRSPVTSAMMQAPSNSDSRWGLQTASGKQGVQFVAAHGGWGPEGENGYSARQLGLVQTTRGLMSVSIASQAASKSREDAVSIVTQATDWLTRNLAQLPAGFCNPTDAAATAPSTDSEDTTPSTSTSSPSTTSSPSSAESTTTSGPQLAGAETAPSTPTIETTTEVKETPAAAESTETAQPTTSASTTASATPPPPAPTTLAAPQSTCKKTVIALDPGHNPSAIEEFDQITGAKMVDYPNGAEDGDVFTVANLVSNALKSDGGYEVVLVKKNPQESVTYRERVDRAEKAGAVIGVSIHTSPGDHSVFPQRVGLFREGPGQDGATKRVEFTASDVAARSEMFAGKFARARSASEGVQVQVRDNTFDGRAPLWSGNIPIISLISTKVVWVYNEFGPASGGGGANKIADGDLQKYADGIVAGIKASAPGKKCG